MFNREDIGDELESILLFWHRMSDIKNHGYYGEADFYGNPNKTAAKGCILNSRILWTFSAAGGILDEYYYRELALRAKNFLVSAFLDKRYGGLYWLVDHTGKALDKRKHFYNIAFGIYGLSEYYRATGDLSSLELAMSLFDVTEKYGLDKAEGGYIEACSREWHSIDDFRLSEKDLNCPKSMNTNLHILEAYTNLLYAVNDESVRKALEAQLRVMLDKIINRDFHFDLFFDMNWNSLTKDISYGHDIEGSWLLYEAARAIGDKSLIETVKQTSLAIAEAVYNAAIDRTNGGLISGCDEAGHYHAKKEWWPQAEAVVGFYNAYELSGDQKFYDASEGIWDYIQKYFVDITNRGDWHNELNSDNTPDTSMPKAGFWKCPYHNARACLEMMQRIPDK